MPSRTASALQQYSGADFNTNGLEELKPFGINGKCVTVDLTGKESLVGRFRAVDLCRGLIQNYTVRSLELYGVDLGPEGAECMQYVLTKNASIQYLGLGNNGIGPLGCQFLANGLRANTTLRVFDVQKNNIGDDGVKALARALTVNDTIQELNLSHNKILHEGGSELGSAVLSNMSLTALDVSHNKLTGTGLNAIANGLRGTLDTQAVTTLKASHNNVSVEACETFFLYMQSCPHLQCLDLSRNRVAEAVSKLIPCMELGNITTLGLSKSFLGGENAAMLAKAIAANRALSDLDISQNYFGGGGDGMSLILQSLRQCPVLRCLNLNECRVKMEGPTLTHLIDLLSTSPTLETLELNHNTFGVDGGRAIARAVEIQTDLQLRYLDLSHTSMGAHGAGVVLGAFSDAPMGRSLLLAGNTIGDEGLVTIATVLKTEGGFGCLRFLDLSDNGLTNLSEPILCELLQISPFIESIRLIGNPVGQGLKEGLIFKSDASKIHDLYQYCENKYQEVSQEKGYLHCTLPEVEYPGAVASSAHQRAQKQTKLDQRRLSGDGDGDQDADEIRAPTSDTRELRRKFDALDHKGDGTVDISTFKKFWLEQESYGLSFTASDFDRFMKDHRMGTSGVVSFEEFCIIMLKMVSW